MSELFVVAMVLVMLLGAAMVALGVVGQRLNNHPICRACRFDLLGLPRGWKRCPECGADILRSRAVCAGARERRPRLMVCGGLLMVMCIAALGGMSYIRSAHIDLNRYKPVWLLRLEAQVSSARGDTIAKEFHRRIDDGLLSEAQHAAVIADVLRWQGNPSRRWSKRWGDVIHKADRAGRLSTEQHDRFLRQVLVVEWEMRPRTSPGGVLPIIGHIKDTRGGTAPMICEIVCGSASVGDVTLDLAWLGGYGGYDEFHWRGREPVRPTPLMYSTGLNTTRGVSWMPGARSGQAGALFQVPPDLPPGRHELDLQMLIHVRDLATAPTLGGRSSTLEDALMTGRRVRLMFPLEVLPPDVPDVALVEPTEAVRAAFEQQLLPRETEAWGYAARQAFEWNSLPLDFAFDVYWRQNGLETRIGVLTSRAAALDEPGFLTHLFPGSAVLLRSGVERKRGPIDVVLRPSIALAQRCPGILEIYGEEIVFSGILPE